MSQSMISLSLNMENTFRTLRDEMLRLHCQNARVQITNLRATQYVNPSAALSVILNKPAYATMGSSTLQEITCVKVSATLKPSLWVGDRLASRPIFHVEFQDSTRQAQLTRGGHLSRERDQTRRPISNYRQPHKIYRKHNCLATLRETLV